MVLFSNESIKIFYHLNSDFVCSWMKFYYYYFFFHFWPASWGVYVLCNFLRQWLFLSSLCFTYSDNGILPSLWGTFVLFMHSQKFWGFPWSGSWLFYFLVSSFIYSVVCVEQIFCSRIPVKLHIFVSFLLDYEDKVLQD